MENRRENKIKDPNKVLVREKNTKMKGDIIK